MPMKSTYLRPLAACDVLKERFGTKIYIVLKTGRGSRWTHLIDIEHEKKSDSSRKALPKKQKTDELMDRLSEEYKDEDALERCELPADVSDRRSIHPFALSNRSEKYREIVLDPTKSKGWKLIRGLLTFDLPLGEKVKRLSRQFTETNLKHCFTARRVESEFCATAKFRTFLRTRCIGHSVAIASED
jgi:putative transposase